jgi:hypothetical protein
VVADATVPRGAVVIMEHLAHLVEWLGGAWSCIGCRAGWERLPANSIRGRGRRFAVVIER